MVPLAEHFHDSGYVSVRDLDYRWKSAECRPLDRKDVPDEFASPLFQANEASAALPCSPIGLRENRNWINDAIFINEQGSGNTGSV